ncbi:hypothetical protein PCCS19_02360 [Paenibacillus sp. CCS19]|uniref:ribonuclease E inhibitor RraB n=1 Tax=Paenibacillus sp. CCS19 TaxID=3158387 RepID=UPI002562AF5F|nr:ribonuclease E inhibitor RraB [Paenibacillus cellulosilyticus]GMK37183.1 hypothetical protein PCCS19_02360 [Paenibacillus cellulosilyticus]
MKKIMKYILVICLICCLVGCNNTKKEDSIRHLNKEMILEQYFYSSNEEDLRELSDKLRKEGYGINDFKSYELRGETEWSFYTSKEVTEKEINKEDVKSEKYAKEFNVGYDGHGFPLE